MLLKKMYQEKQKSFYRIALLLVTIIIIFFIFDFPVESQEKNIDPVITKIVTMQNNALSKVLSYVQSFGTKVEETQAVTTQETENVQQSTPVPEADLINVDTQMHVAYAMIWPIQDTEYYELEGNALGTIKAGTMLTIIEEVGDYFEVYYDNLYVYVPSKICMINLPDVMQAACQYNITNSYSSIYKVNGENIPEVTGEVLYPYVQDQEGDYLVPLLYPVAKQLFEAEADALSQGYTIKIYDAYRPYEVTKYIYSKMTTFLSQNPDYKQYVNGTVHGTTYSQNNFLAKTVSNHNYGVAVDMTLVDVKTGEELAVQSAMHELSIASVLSLNTKDANILQNLMTSHGFTGLVSEWWHFQIRDYRTNYAAFQVSREGYHVTEDGIYYETKDGTITWLSDENLGLGWQELD